MSKGENIMEDPDNQELLSLELKSSKKKKTRKKVDMTQLDAQIVSLASNTSETVTNTEITEQTNTATGEEILDLDLTKKKKKKKKTPKFVDDDGLVAKSDQPHPLEPSIVTSSAQPIIAEQSVEAEPVGFEYVLPKKKRKRRDNITFEGFDEVLAEQGVEVTKDVVIEVEDDLELTDTSTWAGSDRDYTYDELLERVFHIMRQKNPSMVDRKTKLIMKPPQVMRVGARRTSFANFTEICKLLHRQPKHLLAFLLAELGTSGSIDGNNQLIIKGRFQQKQIETVLRRYIKEYVTCHTCRSPDTNLQRENRLFFLQCGTCGSRCTVENVKSGFQAVTNRRSRQQ